MESAPISILTDRRPLHKLARKLLFFITRSPKFLPDAEIDQTVASLRRGFSALGIPFVIDPRNPAGKAALVIANPDALRWALEEKKKAKGIEGIKTVVAGPGIAAAPTDHDKLLTDPAIDRVLLPSEAMKARWVEYDQYFDRKAIVWTAGAADNGIGRSPTGVCLVYARNADEKLFRHIMDMLWEHKVPIVVSNYGQFRSREYLRLLAQARFLIYLDSADNQPLPLYEAWMADVPSLVASGGPPVPPECGMVFNGTDDFEAQLLAFQERYASFAPRPYALGHHSDSVSAGALRSIIEMK